MFQVRVTRPCIGEEEREYLEEVFASGYLTQGPMCKRVENEAKKYLGVKYALVTSNCTCALELALTSLNIKKGDRVIVPDYTFPSPINTVVHRGAVPILIDVNVGDRNINPDSMELALKHFKNVKAVIIIHQFGYPARLDSILSLAEEYDLKVIEDAAAAYGSSYKGRMVGGFGDAGCFSFHPRKIITCGEGGLLVTNDGEVFEKASMLKDHGKRKVEGEDRYGFFGYGWNYRMSDVQAALLLGQMEKIESFIEERMRYIKLYTDLLRALFPPQTLPHVRWNGQTFTVLVNNRSKIIKRMASRGIEVGVGTFACHLQKAYTKLPKTTLPKSKYLYEKAMLLPLYNGMGKENVLGVSHALLEELS